MYWLQSVTWVVVLLIANHSNDDTKHLVSHIVYRNTMFLADCNHASVIVPYLVTEPDGTSRRFAEKGLQHPVCQFADMRLRLHAGA